MRICEVHDMRLYKVTHHKKILIHKVNPHKRIHKVAPTIGGDVSQDIFGVVYRPTIARTYQLR